jgi:hypothetical protein
VPVLSVDQSLGHHRFYESGHVDSAFANVGTSKSVSLQDYHGILSQIKQGIAKIQQGGFIWDLMYTVSGKVHPSIKLAPCIHFIKCDTKEADKNYNNLCIVLYFFNKISSEVPIETSSSSVYDPRYELLHG